MKEIQGRLKNKNKPRIPLGRVEQKQRLIQPCRLLTQLCHHVQGVSQGPCSYVWPSMRTPALGLPLYPVGPATGSSWPCWSLTRPSAISHMYLCGLFQNPPQPHAVQGRLSRWSSEQSGRACSPTVINSIKKTITVLCSRMKE